MGFKAITINTPSTEPAHIYSADDAALYNGIIGVDCVLELGSKMAASIISNNLIRITDGACVIQGHFGRIPFGEYEDMVIENGIADQMRNDIIVARFTTTSSGEVETYELVVLKGMSGISATDPIITIGDLEEGDYVRELPLYRVKISGLSITEVEPLFTSSITLDRVNKFETSGGTATAIALTLPNLVEGLSKTFICSTANGGAATTINTKPLYKPGTTTAPNLVAGKAYTVWYDLAGDRFYLKDDYTSKIINTVLTSVGWVGTSAPYSQEVAISEMTSTSNATVAISPGATTTEYNAAVDAMLHPSTQGDGTITIKAFDSKPTVDIPITVMILG
ncbi:MAG: putative phage tail fiber protein [Anaerocolumna sp.]|jgi:hypothetical protein|nr:putative phage tail fiber protein [Anaerocolumna sp.]